MDNFNMSMMGGGGGNPQGGKKAVHVKWAGKTIALGTFPHQEAEEKCARAKALTRAWRSTMRPKPTREWVMLELERLGVRVVSGRLKSGGPGGEIGGAGVGDDDSADSVGGGGDANKGVNNNNMSGMAAMGMGNNMGMMGNNMPNLGSDPSPGSSNHRPLVGGGSAAAYEAARADHYGKLDNKQGGAAQGGNMGGNINNNMPSMPNNNNNNMAAPMPSFGLSVNPNQHYEMLKLHHMNLLNEIQETTLMMNLYQQQQLQQQGGAGGGNMSNNNMGNMSNNNMNQMGQMGGGNQMGQQNNMTPLMNQGMMNQNQGMNNQGVMLGSNGMNNNAPQDQLSNSQDRPSSSASGNVNGAAAGESKEDKAAWLKQLKDDIAKREKEAEALEASIGNDEKRKNDDGTPSSNKKAKLDTTAV